jgi:hypothetical protein
MHAHNNGRHTTEQPIHSIHNNNRPNHHNMEEQQSAKMEPITENSKTIENRGRTPTHRKNAPTSPEIVLPSCLVSLPLGSTRLFGSYGFGLASPAISGSEGVVPPEIGRNSGPQPPASFLTPQANDPAAVRSDSLSQLISLTRSHSVSLLISPLSQLHSEKMKRR